jgi:YHS domain-containing protein
MKRRQFEQQNQKPIAVIVENPSRRIYKLLISIVFLIVASIILLSCSNEKKEKAETATLLVTKTNLIQTNPVVIPQVAYEIVPNDKVCMVNDRFMGVKQIPIDVDGTTYYGCCQGCVEKLQKNIDDVRFGNNPLNKTKVDKASAVIVQDKSNGSVFYFASKEDAQDFVSKNKA